MDNCQNNTFNQKFPNVTEGLYFYKKTFNPLNKDLKVFNMLDEPGAIKSVNVSSFVPYTGSSNTKGILTISSGRLHDCTWKM